MCRLKIAIIFGGCSEEHFISVESAQEITRHLDLEKCEPSYPGITKSGAWKLCDGPHGNWADAEYRPALLSPDSSTTYFDFPIS